MKPLMMLLALLALRCGREPTPCPAVSVACPNVLVSVDGNTVTCQSPNARRQSLRMGAFDTPIAPPVPGVALEWPPSVEAVTSYQ